MKAVVLFNLLVFFSCKKIKAGILNIKNHTATSKFILKISEDWFTSKIDKQIKREINPPINPNPHAFPEILPEFLLNDKSDFFCYCKYCI